MSTKLARVLGLTFPRTIALGIVTVIALAGSSQNAFAQSNKTAFVGSWLETVTFPAEFGRPPLLSLVTVHADGTMVNSDAGGVTLDPPSAATSAHGGWRHLGNRRFVYTVHELFSDLSGNLTGFLKVRGIYTVSSSGDEYTGTSFAEVFDTLGNLLFSVEVANSGQRLQVELP